MASSFITGTSFIVFQWRTIAVNLVLLLGFLVFSILISLMESKNRTSISGGCKFVRRLKCSVQNYDWGLIGNDSRVGTMFALNSHSSIDVHKPYAEFWMGSHDSGPSYVIESCGGGGKQNGFSAIRNGNGRSFESSSMMSLKSWISQNPTVLGDKVFENWDGNLPFLFKVLSISKALSIQAHPDKEWARTLHRTHPNIYKDDNHKPEMALAITEFEALCGFISPQELKCMLRSVPEIAELVSSEDVDLIECIDEHNAKDKATPILKSIFTQIMLASKETISKAILKMKSRLHMESQVRQLTDKERLAMSLEKQYPGDVGVVCAYFFNHVKLQPGEALYLGANEPHAYLIGECMECMATSDNVVRAGLTPKLKDIQTLCSMLNYKQEYPEILEGVPLNPYTRRYCPPFDEFEIDSCILPRGASTVFPAVPGPSIFVITAGEGTMHNGSLFQDLISEGDVLFVPANTETRVTTTSKLQLYRAGVNSRFF